MRDDAPSPHTPGKRRLDRATWNQLTGIDFRLLDELAFLAKLQASRSPKRSHYCTPGRAWLAQRLGVTPTTISRRTSHLAALGVLHKRQRRPIRGRWQTCLYALVSPAAWYAAAFATRLRRLSHRVTQTTRLALSAKLENAPRPRIESLAAVLARGRLKFAPS